MYRSVSLFVGQRWGTGDRRRLETTQVRRALHVRSNRKRADASARLPEYGPLFIAENRGRVVPGRLSPT